MSIWCGKQYPVLSLGYANIDTYPHQLPDRGHSARFPLMFNLFSALLFELIRDAFERYGILTKVLTTTFRLSLKLDDKPLASGRTTRLGAQSRLRRAAAAFQPSIRAHERAANIGSTLTPSAPRWRQLRRAIPLPARLIALRKTARLIFSRS
ncbi:hypothetical protein H8B02_17625 [Bradyrhizobium sp. Pear77]|uniref:hypothetical protein n=1 Tax=Bradyrhizobium TaxID=374 RepID=UPI001E562907|nr:MULTISPECIES: hypothetical protein [Bradyrhizobium]MCC8955190.1 hypothetical protein [Bradyrhizobium altum]MCC8966734.1 hypothetical protein [Bradyrhizobium oropedii]